MANLNFISDTVTKPTKVMLEAMFNSEVGDDVFMQDPTVNALQKKVAELFGMEDALFCASGTQTNQIAITVHCKPGDEVICDKLSHIYLYEGGGIAKNAGASVRLIEGTNGMFTVDQLKDAYNDPSNIHLPLSRMLSVENTVNKGGGLCWDWEELVKLRKYCDDKGLIYHLDGARVFNALVEKDYSAKDLGGLFDSISICLSKGLGCPVGSVLIGTKDFINRARRVRKLFGGGMRQAGYLAGAAIYALDNHVERLKEDHARAKRVRDVLSEMSYVSEIKPVETNIVIFTLRDFNSNEAFERHLSERGIQIISMGGDLWRITTHLDVNDESIDLLEKGLRSFGN